MPKLRLPTSWVWLLALFSLAHFAIGFAAGPLFSFAPLYLKQLGLPDSAVPSWTGFITIGTFALGIPFLPLWGALADRYTRQLIIVRAFGFFWL